MDLAYVDVAGGGDAQQVATTISVALGARSAERIGDSWFVAHGGIRVWVNDDDAALNDGYPVYASVSGAESPEGAARRIFDVLAEATAWSIALLSEGGVVLAERSALARSRPPTGC